MSIWYSNPGLEAINAMSKDTLVDHLGIEVVELGADYIKATMPVDRRTHQPFGLLHGGASAVLAETLGSIGSFLCIDSSKHACVGLELNASHLRPVREGKVFGIAHPVRLGRTIQVWEVRIFNTKDYLICVSRLTMAVINNKQPAR
jgi:1,4-dihydroxy-2-naphthoyl-CoA hydrolase